jgi:hypothetical protein
MATATDNRPRGREVGRYTSEHGTQRMLWRQQRRDGLGLVDVPAAGSGRRYLIERGLTEPEADALARDYLAEAHALGGCPMRRSRLEDLLLEATS